MTALVALLALLLLGAQAQHGSEWTYSEGTLDELHWPREYPTCGARRQSPINLQRRKVHYNSSLTALNLTGYGVQADEFHMINNGHTVQISLPPTMRLTAPDGTQYTAEQMHFHWGGASSEISGSEHTIDGIRFVAEIHIVHYNSKYESYDRAQSEPDGLAVLAALIEVKDHGENTYYSNFIAHLNNIRHPGQSTVLSGVDILDMLPEDVQHYYSYRGSLTTPPCTENVHWFVLVHHVPLSSTQIWKLENSIVDHHNKTLHNHYRRTQPLNNRVVETNLMNFPHLPYNLGPEFQLYINKLDNKLEYLRRLIEKRNNNEKS
ncbi:carbonic anhydrase 6 [Lontra canadensis]|uniref:carbonic anhydrase 6 n=1 Tax=Lontra canadensis TaxID=76717 RepID=UPI0013F2FB21|nr:carbonic anhydrase 6 [Lontra canadensis]